jgi:hypothetical protein
MSFSLKSNRSKNDSDSSDSNTLSMIDCGIRSLNDLPLKFNLTSINLHSNSISKIENLIYLQNLIYLDLSSNRITKIQGLNGLVSLKMLNLSCNLIVSIENLECLKQLNYLNLSYNKIQYINGLNDLWGRDHALETLILNSNYISSVEEISYYLSGLVRLKHLTLHDNKFLKNVDYRPFVWTNLKFLITLDSKDKSNKKVNVNIRAKSPIISELQEFIEFESTASSSGGNSSNMNNNQNVKRLARKLSIGEETNYDEEIEENESLSSFGPKLEKIEDKIHKLLKIREKLKCDLSGDEFESDDDDDNVLAKKQSKLKKIINVPKKPQKPKSILKSPSSSKVPVDSSLNNSTNINNTTTSSTEQNNNLQEIMKVLQDQLSSYKHTQEENARLIHELKMNLEVKKADTEKLIKDKEGELNKEKELNKLVIKELDDIKKKLESAELKLKQYETKTLKQLNKCEEKLKSAHLKELHNLKLKYENQLRERTDKCAQLEIKYKELEDEFRSALLIESSRFNDLFQKYESQNEEFNSMKTGLKLAEQNELRNKSLINELNDLIKEQKLRIQQLSKMRQDNSEDVQKRNFKLNEAVQDCMKLKAQCEDLKKEKKGNFDFLSFFALLVALGISFL